MRKTFALAVLGLAAALAACTKDAAEPLAPAATADRSHGDLPRTEVELKRIGRPRWRPADFHLFSAPIGTFESGFAEFGTTIESILPPPNHVPHPQLGTGPGAPHPGPYDSEFAHGLASQHYAAGPEFSVADFSAPNGIWLVWMTVPDEGAIGSSPDFASGPIIPNGKMPIAFTLETRRNGGTYSGVAQGTVPALDGSLDPPFAVDGHSHFPFFYVDGAIFAPAGVSAPGHYEYRFTFTDMSGDGWRFNVRFEVKR